jgi:hypothetical protein
LLRNNSLSGIGLRRKPKKKTGRMLTRRCNLPGERARDQEDWPGTRLLARDIV